LASQNSADKSGWPARRPACVSSEPTAVCECKPALRSVLVCTRHDKVIACCVTCAALETRPAKHSSTIKNAQDCVQAWLQYATPLRR
jgi:hypothetical protein